MIVKTEAIVLRKVDFSETSIIATLFTRKSGVIAVIAKGAKKPKSKFAASLVPGQLLEVIFYYKDTREVQTLSEVSYLQKLNGLRTDVAKMALVHTALELVGQVVHDNEVNVELYDFISRFLIWINGIENPGKIVFPYIQFRILERIGIGLQPHDAIINGTNGKGDGYINIETGTLSESADGSQSVKLTADQFQFLRRCLTSKNSSILNMTLTEKEITDLIEYLDKYIRYHVEGVKPRKSDSIFAQIV